MILTSWSRKQGKLILRNYFLLTIFIKRFIVDVWHHWCLNKTWILNIPEFWLYRGSEYTRVLNLFLILNVLGFWIYHSSKYAGVTQGFEYVLIIPEYAWLCLNEPKSVWMAFVLHLLIVISYLKEGKNFIFFYSSWKYLILFIVLD